MSFLSPPTLCRDQWFRSAEILTSIAGIAKTLLTRSLWAAEVQIISIIWSITSLTPENTEFSGDAVAVESRGRRARSP
jgi:hypothetical protein